jgi:hypothetical protein
MHTIVICNHINQEPTSGNGVEDETGGSMFPSSSSIAAVEVWLYWLVLAEHQRAFMLNCHLELLDALTPAELLSEPPRYNNVVPFRP